jgi:hypothetical protein
MLEILTREGIRSIFPEDTKVDEACSVLLEG